MDNLFIENFRGIRRLNPVADGVSTGTGKKSENEHPMNIRMAMIDMTTAIFLFIITPF